ncbi:Hypothetical predicted protein, partial [Olea europaea subsp. europaea]
RRLRSCSAAIMTMRWRSLQSQLQMAVLMRSIFGFWCSDAVLTTAVPDRRCAQ